LSIEVIFLLSEDNKVTVVSSLLFSKFFGVFFEELLAFITFLQGIELSCFQFEVVVGDLFLDLFLAFIESILGVSVGSNSSVQFLLSVINGLFKSGNFGFDGVEF